MLSVTWQQRTAKQIPIYRADTQRKPDTFETDAPITYDAYDRLVRHITSSVSRDFPQKGIKAEGMAFSLTDDRYSHMVAGRTGYLPTVERDEESQQEDDLNLSRSIEK